MGTNARQSPGKLEGFYFPLSPCLAFANRKLMLAPTIFFRSLDGRHAGELVPPQVGSSEAFLHRALIGDL
jgi:hypothetical protein